MDKPRSLANEAERKKRFGMLNLDHIKPLTDYTKKLEQKGYGSVPFFDPMDGGIEASSLFLFEKPGPKADSSGFISRDNNDATAQATFEIMQKLNIDRKAVCLWNVIPGWNGTIKVNNNELKAGIACLNELFDLMPKLKVVMLVGKKAEKARGFIQDRNLEILSSYHPSPKVRSIAPEKWHSIPQSWGKVSKLI
jgi:uracil-DNA glycosylase